MFIVTLSEDTLRVWEGGQRRSDTVDLSSLGC